LGIGLGLGLGLKSTSNNVQPTVQPILESSEIIYEAPTKRLFTSENCKEFIDTCKTRIRNGLVPESALEGCIEMAKAYGCKNL
jgi:hypothetical protein